MSDNEKIERYIYGEMSQSEKSEFENEILQNPDLAKQVALSRKVDEFLGDKPFLDFSKTLEEIKQEKFQAKNSETSLKSISRNNRFYYLAAASIIIICTVGAFLIYNYTRTTDPDTDLFAVNYIPKSINRGGTTNNDSLSNAAFNLFTKKQFASAIPLLNTLLSADSTNMEYWLCKGISHYEAKSFSEAINAFDHILNKAPNLFVEQAEWLLALSYYKNNQKDKAKMLFEKIATSTSFYNHKASEVLKLNFSDL